MTCFTRLRVRWRPGSFPLGQRPRPPGQRLCSPGSDPAPCRGPQRTSVVTAMPQQLHPSPRLLRCPPLNCRDHITIDVGSSQIIAFVPCVLHRSACYAKNALGKVSGHKTRGLCRSISFYPSPLRNKPCAQKNCTLSTQQHIPNCPALTKQQVYLFVQCVSLWSNPMTIMHAVRKGCHHVSVPERQAVDDLSHTHMRAGYSLKELSVLQL